MSEHTPTLLIVYLHPGNDEGARFHLDETLTMAAIAYHLIAELEERVALEGCAPFVVMHPEKRLVFALHAPLDPKTIGDIAQLVTSRAHPRLCGERRDRAGRRGGSDQ